MKGIDYNLSEVVCKSSDTAEWLAARRGMVTASEVGTILGLNPWDSPYALWARKVGLAPDIEATPDMEWGLTVEAALLRAYEKRSGRVTSPAGDLLRSRERPWLGCTLDGTAFHDGQRIPVEAKNVNIRMADDWEEGPPPYYAAQIQTQMLVTGATMASAVVCIGGRAPIWDDIEADPGFQKTILRECERFHRLVTTRTSPEVDGSEATSDTIKAIHAHSDPEKAAVSLPIEACAWAEQLEEIKKQRKALDEREAQLENCVKLIMGDAERANLPGGGAFTWKTQKRESYVVKATSFRVFKRTKK